MNLNNLKCLLAVVEAGSISQAARDNFISQQALSDQIRRLEEHFQTRLLERTRPIRLTPAGQVVYDAAREMQNTMDNMEAQVARLREPRPALVISTGRTRTPTFLPQLIARFQEEMPGAEVRLIRPAAVREEVNVPLPGADLIIGNMPFGPEVEGRELFSDVLCMVVSEQLLCRCFGEDWRREEERLNQGITLEECLAFPALGKLGGNSRDLLDFSGESMNNLDVAVYRCSAGLEAIALPARLAVETFGREKRLRFFPIVPEQVVFRVGIGFRKGWPLSGAARTFIRLAGEYFQEEAAR